MPHQQVKPRQHDVLVRIDAVTRSNGRENFVQIGDFEHFVASTPALEFQTHLLPLHDRLVKAVDLLDTLEDGLAPFDQLLVIVPSSPSQQTVSGLLQPGYLFLLDLVVLLLTE